MKYRSPKDVEDRKTRKWERNIIFRYNKELHSDRSKRERRAAKKAKKEEK